MTVLMRLAGRILRLQRTSLDTVERARAIGERVRTPAPLPTRMQRRYDVRTKQVRGFAVVTLSPREVPPTADLVYLHGGAYVNALVGPHWAILDQLARRTGARITVPMYPLAPEHDVDDAYAFLDAAMASVVAGGGGRPLHLAGDSAGGGLALGLAIRARDSSPAIDGLLLFSPWVDATMTNPRAREMEEADAMLGVDGLRFWAERWSGARSVDDVMVSPIRDSLVGLPPIRIYQGGRELFLPDVIAFARKARAAGTETRLRIYPDGFHVFMGLTVARESRSVFRDAAAAMRAEPGSAG